MLRHVADACRRYAADPGHLRLIADLVAPMVATRMAVQLVLDDD